MAIPTLDECKPGMRVTGWNILVVPEPVEDRIGSIIIPDSTKDKEAIVQQRGRIVSIGPAAFDHADYRGQEPQIGDPILFAKLAGFRVKLASGHDARVIQDKDVAAILDEEAA